MDHTDNYKPPNLGGPPIEFDLKLFFGVIVIPVDQLGEEIELLFRSSRFLQKCPGLNHLPLKSVISLGQ